jgi:hypothetical protein
MFQQENQKYRGMNTTAGDVIPIHNEGDPPEADGVGELV